MSRGHQPVRMCVACRRRRPKSELLRFVISASGVELDPQQHLAVRGAYICPDSPTCWEEKKLRRTARNKALVLSQTVAAYCQGG